jgi:sec-independent protein translocase protein TatA
MINWYYKAGLTGLFVPAPEGDPMFDGILAPQHLIIILVIVLVIFGPKRLPEIGRGLGKGIREFKGSMNEVIEGSDDAKENKEVKSESKNS